MLIDHSELDIYLKDDTERKEGQYLPKDVPEHIRTMAIERNKKIKAHLDFGMIAPPIIRIEE